MTRSGPPRPRALVLVALIAACGGHRKEGCSPPLEKLAPTSAATLGPGNESGQDEDPSLLVTRMPDSLIAAWYSDRLGAHPDGLARREIFVTLSYDGKAWLDPTPATDSHAWSFYPSLARDPNGFVWLAFMRWHLLPDGCIYFDAQHCPGDPGCCTGTDRRILVSASYDGITWSEAASHEVASGPADEQPSIVAASDGRLLAYFVSGYRGGDTRRQLQVAVRDSAGWHAPVALGGVDDAASNAVFPHAVEVSPGAFLLAFTRYDLAAGDDAFDPSAEVLVSSSADGVQFDAPTVVSGPSPARVDVFPWIYPESDGRWSVLWVTESGTLTRPLDLSSAEAPIDIPGYSPRLVPTPTDRLYWAAWVEGTDPNQQVRWRFVSR